MRDAVNIRIEELILHILDPQGQGLVLSSVPVPLSSNEALVDYFSMHIQGSLKDAGLKSARFRNINPEQPSGVCRDLLRSLLESAGTCCAAKRPCWMARAG